MGERVACKFCMFPLYSPQRFGKPLRHIGWFAPCWLVTIEKAGLNQLCVFANMRLLGLSSACSLFEKPTEQIKRNLDKQEGEY